MHTKKKARILIVDDIPANLLALSAVLSSPKYELTEARSGGEAVKLCREQEFALIVLDVSMPGIDGFETARLIKTDSLNKEVPIVFVTATYQEDPSVRRGFEVGAVDYFGKPFDPEVLKLKVGIYTDLYLKTKRLEETEELLKTHAQIQTLLEAIPVGVIICDAAGRIYESNEEARRIWGGVRKVELAEYRLCKGWWPDTGKPLMSDDWAMARALKNGESTKEEHIDIETFDGQKRSIVNSAYPIRGKDGTILGAVAVLQDITVRKAAAETLELRTSQLRNELRDGSARAG